MIEVKLISGIRKKRVLGNSTTFALPLRKLRPLPAKEVIKDGRSFAAKRTGPVRDEPTKRVSWRFVPYKIVGRINIFVRENRWLEAIYIIDQHGNPYERPILKTRPSSTLVKNKRRGHAKKTKPNVVVRRKGKTVKDFIDLS